MHNFSYENEFYPHVNETHFHMKGYAPRLALKKQEQHNSDQQWPLELPSLHLGTFKPRAFFKPCHLEHITSLNPAMGTCSEILL